MKDLPGFRLCPTAEELFEHYLWRKNLGGDTRDIDRTISTVDFCSFDPWQLPAQSKNKSSDMRWYFFGQRKYKYNTGKGQQDRRTASGFWKKTGTTLEVKGKRRRNRGKMGEKRVLVFHLNNRPGGTKTDWIMHEYTSPNNLVYSICKIKFKGEETEMTFNPGNEPQILSIKIDPVFDCLEDLQGVDMMLDDSSNEQPSNNPPIHTIEGGQLDWEEIDIAFKHAVDDKWKGLLANI